MISILCGKVESQREAWGLATDPLVSVQLYAYLEPLSIPTAIKDCVFLDKIKIVLILRPIRHFSIHSPPTNKGSEIDFSPEH
jgi:hypothetical protein